MLKKLGSFQHSAMPTRCNKAKTIAARIKFIEIRKNITHGNELKIKNVCVTPIYIGGRVKPTKR